MQNNKIALFFVLLITAILAPTVLALSADEALAIVSVQNNYILLGESASVAKAPITYKNNDYTIVAAIKNSEPQAYIPIKNSTSEIAAQDLEVRELIKTTIVYTKASALSQSTATADWPFSYSTKSYLSDLSEDFKKLANSLTSVSVELDSLTEQEAKTLSAKALTLKTMSEGLQAKSLNASGEIEAAMAFEQNYFNKPDTNKTIAYENYYSSYFANIAEIKSSYTELDAGLNELSQGIAALQSSGLTAQQKSGLQAIIQAPINARRLPNFLSQTDQIRTLIEKIFNDAKNSESYASTLKTRITRNEAWIIIYGNNEELIKLDKSFTNLSAAAEAVLLSDNVDYWSNQDAVEALKTNWTNAKTKFENAEYTKAKEYAAKATQQVKLIIADGVISNPNNTQDLLVKGIIGIAIAAIAIILLKHFLKKKKPEEYNEPEY